MSMRGKSGAYLSLKLRLPATRVAPLAAGSADTACRRLRSRSPLAFAGRMANHA